MTKKQKIIVSTTGIFLVLLILVGLTYAYFLTRIKGNEHDKSISVSTANLILEYADIDDIVVGGENVEPGTTWTKKFSATNKGSKKVEYGVALENVLNTLERTKDLVYTLNCTSSLGTTCNKVETEQEFPVIGTILITNNIEPEEVQSYELIVTYKEQNEDQSVDMNKKIYAKANIVNPSTFGPLGTGTLASAIIDSAKTAFGISDTTRTKWGSTVTNITGPSEVNERFLNDAPDDYGLSYYYRGNIQDNYVLFANKTWRIVRINGDGSVRIILDDVIKNESDAEITSQFNEKSDDNAYIGYMYGMVEQTETNVNQCIKLNSDGKTAEVDTTNTTEETCITSGGKWAPTPYDATHVNVVSSSLKITLENWYKTNIVDTSNSKFIAENIFCNNKMLRSGTGIGKDRSDYGMNNNFSALVSEIDTPSLECAKGALNNYSRFTSINNSDSITVKNVSVNKDLTYPVGTLTADEITFAGSYNSQDNDDYYLGIEDVDWISLTPSAFYGKSAFIFNETGVSGWCLADTSDGTFGVRPVINLRSDLLISSGDGTETNPYQVKLPTE